MSEEEVLQSDFCREMVRQLRALDTYGVQAGKTAAELLAPFVLTPERKAQLPLVGEPDARTIERVHVFYNAVAVLIEKECGLMASPVIALNHEGFGRALVLVGKLVAVDKTLRDVHRFGFESLSAMKTEADKLLSVALQRIGAYPEVAGL